MKAILIRMLAGRIRFRRSINVIVDTGFFLSCAVITWCFNLSWLTVLSVYLSGFSVCAGFAIAGEYYYFRPVRRYHTTAVRVVFEGQYVALFVDVITDGRSVSVPLQTRGVLREKDNLILNGYLILAKELSNYARKIQSQRIK